MTDTILRMTSGRNRSRGKFHVNSNPLYILFCKDYWVMRFGRTHLGYRVCCGWFKKGKVLNQGSLTTAHPQVLRLHHLKQCSNVCDVRLAASQRVTSKATSSGLHFLVFWHTIGWDKHGRFLTRDQTASKHQDIQHVVPSCHSRITLPELTTKSEISCNSSEREISGHICGGGAASWAVRDVSAQFLARYFPWKYPKFLKGSRGTRLLGCRHEELNIWISVVGNCIQYLVTENEIPVLVWGWNNLCIVAVVTKWKKKLKHILRNML